MVVRLCMPCDWLASSKCTPPTPWRWLGQAPAQPRPSSLLTWSLLLICCHQFPREAQFGSRKCKIWQAASCGLWAMRDIRAIQSRCLGAMAATLRHLLIILHFLEQVTAVRLQTHWDPFIRLCWVLYNNWHLSCYLKYCMSNNLQYFLHYKTHLKPFNFPKNWQYTLHACQPRLLPALINDYDSKATKTPTTAFCACFIMLYSFAALIQFVSWNF